MFYFSDFIRIDCLFFRIPAPTVPPVVSRFSDVFVDAIGIALVAFAVDLSMGKLLANKRDYQVEANQARNAF